MDKRITAVKLSALMVLTALIALVPAASAAQIVDAPFEFIGAVNTTVGAPVGSYFYLAATSQQHPGILYYDLDDGVGMETLTFFTLTDEPLTIGKDNLTYTTTLWPDPESPDKYFVSWLGEKYYVISNGTGKWIISDLVVDEDEKDDHLLRVGETLTLKQGWAITALEIDVDGKKAWMSLSKDGEEVANKVVKEYNPDDASSGYFVYKDDILSEKDVEVMNFTVNTVFAGMNTNLVKINDVDLISTEAVEVKPGNDEVIDDYKVVVGDTTLEIINLDDISLAEDGVVDIMGGRFSVRVTKEKRLAALVRILTEPGTYELIGEVNDSESPGQYFFLDATSQMNPSILYYDLDDGIGQETLQVITYTAEPLTVPKGNLTYTTQLWQDPDSPEKYFVSWLGEKYYVVSNGTGKWIISDLVVDEDEKDDHLLRVGETLTLSQGWAITALEIDVDGKKAWMSLSKDGEEVSNKVVKEYNPDDPTSGYFVYKDDILSEKDVEVMNFTVNTVFAGMNTNLVKINDVDLISTEAIEVKPGNDEVIDDYKVVVGVDTLAIENLDEISLAEDGMVDVMGGRFSVKVTKDNKLAALVKVVTIEGIGHTPTPTVTRTAEPTETVPGTGTAGPTGPAETGTAKPPTPTPTPTDTPGFEAVFAVSGLLAVAYLVMRQRE